MSEVETWIGRVRRCDAFNRLLDLVQRSVQRDTLEQVKRPVLSFAAPVPCTLNGFLHIDIVGERGQGLRQLLRQRATPTWRVALPVPLSSSLTSSVIV